MNALKKTPLALLLPVLLAGCGGGGGIDLLDVPESKPVAGGTPAATKPDYKKVDAPKAGDFTETGYSAVAPLKNLDKDGTDALTKLYTVNPEEQVFDKSNQYDSVKFDDKDIDINVNLTNRSWNAAKEAAEIPVSHSETEFMAYDEGGENARPILRLTQYDHTRVGLLQTYKDEKTFSTIFYRGKDKTVDVPVSGQATYSGHWEFAHQLHGQDDREGGGVGALYSDDFVAVFHDATFTADFGKKKLTGNLNAKSGKTTIDYSVKADISGNSFTGTGEGSYDFDGGNPPVNGSNGINENSKAAVSGSFYGAGAAELAGRLVENDNAFVGAFAARQSGQTDLKTDGDLFQAGVMNFNKVGDTDSYKLGEYQGTNFSGDIKKLQIDGEVIDLDGEALSDNVQSMQFGKLQQEDSQTAQYYVQGYLTKKSDVPTTGKAEYAGHWSGYGEGNAVFSGSKMDARFSADWASKKLDGKLFNANQALEGDPAIAFSADIDGNAFSGTTNRFKLSTDTSSLDSRPITGEASVSGHFYGDKANELGGHIRKDDGSFGGVFGGKQLN